MWNHKKVSGSCVAASVIVGTVLGCGIVRADEQKLECKLYIAESMDSAASHMVSIENSKETLATLRRSGVCIFADGSVADKQFVMVNRITEEGNRGNTQGFSTYTMENGDSVSAQFTGGWGDGPFMGTYQIIGGTGAYANAKGDGTIDGSAQDPWKTTSVVNIVLNITSP